MAAKSKKKHQNSNGSEQIPDNSPLRLFGEVKDRINDLYLRLDKCVETASSFYRAEKVDPEILANVDTNRLDRLSSSIQIIRGVLSRNQMKVAFFGRTSAGKSTVINAILHEKVLPMSCGHTTACFLQVQGTTDDAFLERQNEQRQPIQSVLHIANALNNDCLETSTLVKIYWPISKCSLLKHDVALVDSPGVDLRENVDDWIDKHCHDADVFVLVTNAESSLSESEKGFFHKVNEKLSKPNVFILYNRWDRIVEEADNDCLDQIHTQHTKNAVDFLTDQLKISTRNEAEKRIFFVSAIEALRLRSNLKSSRESERLQDFDKRYEEFVNFERYFEELLSKSAVKTKFKQHTDKGQETIEELAGILNKTQHLITQVAGTKRHDLNLYEQQDLKIHQLFYDNEDSLENKKLEIKKRVQIVLDKELDKEINFLSRIVKDFELRFPTNREDLDNYKEKLYHHVEDSLKENFKTRINNVLEKHVNPFSESMCCISKLLSEKGQQEVKQVVLSQSYKRDDIFTPSIYRKLYTGFQEDLEFRFSLGLVTIIRKFQSVFTGNRHSSDNTLDSSQTSLPMHTDLLSVMERFMINPPHSPTTVGSLAVGGILVRTVGWKVIVVTTVVYGALYAYEYLTWTNAAKEKTFKAQYVRYAKRKLQDSMPIITEHLANSVEQNMTTSLSKVKEEVEKEDKERRLKISSLRSSLVALEECDRFTTKLLGESDVLMRELLNFASSFLSQ